MDGEMKAKIERVKFLRVDAMLTRLDGYEDYASKLDKQADDLWADLEGKVDPKTGEML